MAKYCFSYSGIGFWKLIIIL